jgi:hypothetical protein
MSRGRGFRATRREWACGSFQNAGTGRFDRRYGVAFKAPFGLRTVTCDCRETNTNELFS